MYTIFAPDQLPVVIAPHIIRTMFAARPVRFDKLYFSFRPTLTQYYFTAFQLNFFATVISGSTGATAATSISGHQSGRLFAFSLRSN